MAIYSTDANGELIITPPKCQVCGNSCCWCLTDALPEEICQDCYRWSKKYIALPMKPKRSKKQK